MRAPSDTTPAPTAGPPIAPVGAPTAGTAVSQREAGSTVGGAVDPGRRALAGLLRACEPPAPAVGAFVGQVGARAAWAAIATRRAPRVVLAATAARVQGRSAAELDADAEADLVTAGENGARLIGPEDPEWPTEAFAAFELAGARGVSGSAPPLALYVRGRSLAGLPGTGITVVGSRACTPYGRRVAAEWSAALADDGLTIISGAAFGIDAAAHQAALHASGPATGLPPAGPTVAVLACGIDRAYPQANAALLSAIASRGTVISEYPPGTTPARHRFLVRNRLIAALGRGTLVVEAGRRSGTLSTASAADALGRLVMAVPGPVTSALSVGCHLLLGDRFAQLVTTPQDVLSALGWRGAGRVVGDPGGGVDRGSPRVVASGMVDARHPTDGLDDDCARVHEALPTRRAASVTELSVESALPAMTVLGGLGVLETLGLVERDGSSWRRRPR
ncbi:DNA-protecting protein DprA [Nakamurella flavida]|uniref:DNA-protecting protein DprA n=1 Tax=Nakamurella flavida TaxID=363630 RepID=A0A938YML0_9ACTN|nr:DNA-processing protein DprA [Nakamurella flavida]MBM9476142.1 DNA-protecting protein DprA [Nakamurella flavida]MDP9777113.1 DNA processing protein [Nakamurella flavida]